MMPTFAFPCEMSDMSIARLCRIYWRAVAESTHIELGCNVCCFSDFKFAIRGQLESEMRVSRSELKQRGVNDADLDEIYRLACCTARENRFQHDFILPKDFERKCNAIQRTAKARRLPAG
jgi:hypothetical protein